MAGTGRQILNERENNILQELILKYKLNSATTLGSQAAKKAAWARLVEDYNSIDANSKKTEAQLKKCWENLKTRRKSVRLSHEKGEGIRTEGGSVSPNLRNRSTSSELQVLEVSLADQTDFKLLEVIYSDDTSTEEMSEVLLDSEVLTKTPKVQFPANESRTQVFNESAIERDHNKTPPYLSEFLVTDYSGAPTQAAPAATHAQIEALINFMSENIELARGQLRSTGGRVRSKRLWEGLCNSLNSMGSCMKSVEQWQRVWADKKHLAKKAAAAARRSACATGGPSVVTTLSQVELRILSIMGEGFGEPQTDARVPAFPLGPPGTQDPAAISPSQTSAATPADRLSQEQRSMSPEALELDLPTRIQQRSRNIRNGVVQEDFSSPGTSYDRCQKREEELHKLKIAEKEWLVKAAEENYYKAKAEREAAEEHLLVNRAKRKEAEIRLLILKTQN